MREREEAEGCWLFIILYNSHVSNIRGGDTCARHKGLNWSVSGTGVDSTYIKLPVY